MSDAFQRLFTMSDAQPLALNAQAALGNVHTAPRSQFSWLMRHFLERFFNHETASPDGDARTRIVQLAVATGLPGLVVGMYLWPVYHPFPHWPAHESTGGPPPYWLQVNHHFFFVLYSFVVMGIVTVFEWDLFFPDLLDVFVLTTLPVPDRRLFLARVAAIGLFIAGFLFNANFLAPLVLPAATDPPNLVRFLAGHLAAVAGSGLFSAAFVLALQGVVLTVFGERLFRRVSLLLQGLSITALLMLLLLFPMLSGAVPVFLKSGNDWVLWCPPFWFLGMYQRLLEGPSALPIYGRLAETGCVATLIVVGLAMLTYPIAYLRRVRQLVEGSGTRDTRNGIAPALDPLTHATVARRPVGRAVFHFIGQTILRVQRYRIYLVLYGGVGLSIVVASILRFEVVQSQVRMEISADGLRMAIGVIAFWMIAGLRMAFTSPGNKQGSWVFRIVHGRPPELVTAMEELQAARTWVLLWALTATFAALFAFQWIAPAELRTWPSIAGRMVMAAGLCLLLTDMLFLNVKYVAFTGETGREQPNLAFTVLKYFAFLPVVVTLPLALSRWIEAGWTHALLAAAVIAGIHLLLIRQHRVVIAEHCAMVHLEDDEEEFPMRLGLRY
jgi:hypothetical protein